jgi:hypothetical protein
MRPSVFAAVAWLLVLPGESAWAGGENCNPVTGICGKCVNCGNDQPRPRARDDDQTWTAPPSQEEIRRAQEEQGRRAAAEQAVSKARGALDRGNLGAAIRFLEEALRYQPADAALQLQLQDVRTLQETRKRQATRERIAAVKRQIAALEAEEARLADEHAAAQVRLDQALRALGPKITPGRAFQQLEQAASRGQRGRLESESGTVGALRAPWDDSAPLSLPPLPTALSAPTPPRRPEDRTAYAGYEQERDRLQAEYAALQQELTATGDPVAQSRIKTQMAGKKSEIDTVVVKMLDLSFQLDNKSPPEQIPPPPPPPPPSKEKE